MKLEKNKKGSHVGMVLSFTLFITFLIFIYQIIMPSVTTFDEDYEILESFKKRVLENVSDEVYVIRAYDGEWGDYISIDNSNFDMGPDLNVVAFDSSGNEIESSYDSSITDLWGDNGNVVLYYHRDFVRTNLNTPDPGADVSEIKNILVEERILETKILELINLVENDYPIARKEFGLVGEYEFDVQFKYENGTWIKKSLDRSYKTNIYSKQFSINYLTVNAKEEVGEIIVKIW